MEELDPQDEAAQAKKAMEKLVNTLKEQSQITADRLEVVSKVTRNNSDKLAKLLDFEHSEAFRSISLKVYDLNLQQSDADQRLKLLHHYWTASRQEQQLTRVNDAMRVPSPGGLSSPRSSRYLGTPDKDSENRRKSAQDVPTTIRINGLLEGLGAHEEQLVALDGKVRFQVSRLTEVLQHSGNITELLDTVMKVKSEQLKQEQEIIALTSTINANMSSAMGSAATDRFAMISEEDKADVAKLQSISLYQAEQLSNHRMWLKQNARDVGAIKEWIKVAQNTIGQNTPDGERIALLERRIATLSEALSRKTDNAAFLSATARLAEQDKGGALLTSFRCMSCDQEVPRGLKMASGHKSQLRITSPNNANRTPNPPLTPSRLPPPSTPSTPNTVGPQPHSPLPPVQQDNYVR
jgi:hypothetical protein